MLPAKSFICQLQTGVPERSERPERSEHLRVLTDVRRRWPPPKLYPRTCAIYEVPLIESPPITRSSLQGTAQATSESLKPHHVAEISFRASPSSCIETFPLPHPLTSCWCACFATMLGRIGYWGQLETFWCGLHGQGKLVQASRCVL